MLLNVLIWLSLCAQDLLPKLGTAALIFQRPDGIGMLVNIAPHVFTPCVEMSVLFIDLLNKHRWG